MTNERSARVPLFVDTGKVIVASDAHYWPGPPSSAHRALVRFIKKMKPAAIIMNGDVIDAATISRHPPIGWEHHPTIEEELDVSKKRLDQIERAFPRAGLFWTLGNHDARYNTRLATLVPEFKGVKGTKLSDHFPNWTPAWAVDINGGTVVKHRFKGGMNAAQNNAISSGRNIITGHLHSLRVSPFTDYNGTRYGVDGGTLADPLGPQFTGYTEDNPLNWRSGFVVLTFVDGKLLWPEIVHVVDELAGIVEFRGELIHV